MSLNGDHTSKFSVLKLDEPKKTKRGIGRKSRITGKQRIEATRKRGGSCYARQAQAVEKLIGKPIIVEEKKKWYLYDNGIWKYAGETEQFLKLAWDVQGLDDVNSRTARLIIDSVVIRNHIGLELFCGCIRNDPTNDSTGENAYLINCPNGVLRIDLDSGKVIEKIGHSPDYMFTSCLAVDYDEKAECPKFLEVIRDILPDKRDRELLLLFFAYCLFPNCRLEKALFCVGSGGNGKSLLTNIIASVFGKDNRISITLKEICKKDRKQLIRLVRKVVNVSTEVEVDPIKDSATFKMLVSGEEIETDRIYSDALTINPKCKFCLLTNRMPEFGKGSNAEIRRTRIIHFAKVYQGNERDTKLAEKLAGEKAGILNLLVNRLKQIAIMDDFPLGGHESRMAEDAFRVGNNPIRAFAEKYFTITNNENHWLPRNKVVKLYQQFAADNSIEPLYRDTMLRELYENYPNMKASPLERKTLGDDRCYIVKCVKLKSV